MESITIFISTLGHIDINYERDGECICIVSARCSQSGKVLTRQEINANENEIVHAIFEELGVY